MPGGLEPVDGTGVSHAILDQHGIPERTTGLRAVKLEFLAHICFEPIRAEEMNQFAQHGSAQAKSRKMPTAAVC